MNDYTFGNFLYDLRMEKGLSQSQLGEMMGVSNKAVSKWEMGISKPRPAMLVMLASFFGVTVEELLAGARNTQTENEPVKKDDTVIKTWTGEYRKKKRNAKNAVITAFLIPAFLFLSIAVIANAFPNDEVAGPIILVVTMFAEAIDIALIFVFYASARRLKRILYSNYPEKTVEITKIISPEKEKKEKKDRVPPLKWEKVCYIIGACISFVFVTVTLIFKLLKIDYEQSDAYFIITLICLGIMLILTIVPTVHYYLRNRRKK